MSWRDKRLYRARDACPSCQGDMSFIYKVASAAYTWGLQTKQLGTLDQDGKLCCLHLASVYKVARVVFSSLWNQL